MRIKTTRGIAAKTIGRVKKSNKIKNWFKRTGAALLIAGAILLTPISGIAKNSSLAINNASPVRIGMTGLTAVPSRIMFQGNAIFNENGKILFKEWVFPIISIAGFSFGPFLGVSHAGGKAPEPRTITTFQSLAAAGKIKIKKIGLLTIGGAVSFNNVEAGALLTLDAIPLTLGYAQSSTLLNAGANLGITPNIVLTASYLESGGIKQGVFGTDMIIDRIRVMLSTDHLAEAIKPGIRMSFKWGYLEAMGSVNTKKAEGSAHLRASFDL